jgi:hypothetical protein
VPNPNTASGVLPARAESHDQPSVPHATSVEFECLVRRAGLTLTTAQMSEMHQAFSVVEAMAARVRKVNGHQAEPAVTFSASQSSSS